MCLYYYIALTHTYHILLCNTDIISLIYCSYPYSPFTVCNLVLSLPYTILSFEFCVFVAGWRHALRSEWPFIIIIIRKKARKGPNLAQ